MRAGPPPRAQQLFTLAMMVAMLVFVLVMRARCAEGTANLFHAIDQPASDGGVGHATDGG